MARTAPSPVPPEPPPADSPPLDPSPPIPFELEPVYLGGHPPRPEGRILAGDYDEEQARWNLGGSGDPQHPSNRPGYHPATRVIVEVGTTSRRLPKSAKGRKVLTQLRLLAELRKRGYWPFRSCYEESVRRTLAQPGAGRTREGESRLRLGVRSDGRVVSARVLSTRLERATGQCLSEAAREITIQPAPGRSFWVDLRVRLFAGDAPLSPLSSEPPPELDAELGAHLAERAEPSLRRCCESGLSADPALWGRIALAVETAPDGAITQVTERESRFSDPRVVACSRAAILALGRLESTPRAAIVLPVRCGEPPHPAEPEAVPPAE